MQVRAHVTFSPDANVGNLTTLLLNIVRSWSDPQEGYRVEVAGTGSGRELALTIGIELLRSFPQPHHLAGGIGDDLVSLSNKYMTIELA